MIMDYHHEEKHKHLQFTVEALGWVNMWYREDKKHSIIKQYYIIVIIFLTTFPILADFITQFYEENLFITNLNENLIALSALYGVIYISICFTQKNKEIMLLVEDLSIFQRYSPKHLILETEKSTQFYTKLFITYGVIGNIGYGLLPFLTYNDCLENKSVHMQKYGISCGLVVRFVLPFRSDYSPVSELVILEEIAVCTLGTTIIMMVTMLFCGILIHATTHLKHLKSLILDISTKKNVKLEEHIKFIIKFHSAILSYCSRAEKCFSPMMLLHITLTGFILSVLGFEIIMVKNYIETMRFVLHLSGWLGVLFLVCHYGQQLMDESFAIASAVYSINWYEKPVEIRKDLALILLRSQKPLTIRAAGLKVMSYATFLGVLYTAYSYFTLLLKLKP